MSNNKNYIHTRDASLLCMFLIGYHNPNVDKYMDLNTGVYLHLHRFADNNLAKINSVKNIFEDDRACVQAYIHLLCDWELIPKSTFGLIRTIKKMKYIK